VSLTNVEDTSGETVFDPTDSSSSPVFIVVVVDGDVGVCEYDGSYVLSSDEVAYSSNNKSMIASRDEDSSFVTVLALAVGWVRGIFLPNLVI
jgi:hypothetical protein